MQRENSQLLLLLLLLRDGSLSDLEDSSSAVVSIPGAVQSSTCCSGPVFSKRMDGTLLQVRFLCNGDGVVRNVGANAADEDTI